MGCVEVPRRGGGSHRKWLNPATGMMTTVPNWGSRDLKMGTVRAVIRQLGLDWQAFHDAL
jgi:mRNA interferase HicA